MPLRRIQVRRGPIDEARKRRYLETPGYRYPAATARVEYEPQDPRPVRFDRAAVDWSALDADDRFPND